MAKSIKTKQKIRLLKFYWLTSTIFAICGYFILWLLMPHHYVFGAWYRMILYHWEHPIQYILIPCFFYGIIATALAEKFLNKKIVWRIFWTTAIIFLTILVSSPFGGMLWHLHDMLAGFFPKRWIVKILCDGSILGLEVGWAVILLSIPYNILGSVICFFLTVKGAKNMSKNPT